MPPPNYKLGCNRPDTLGNDPHCGTQDRCTPVGAVRMQLAGMSNAIEQLADSISALRERLDPVLKPTGPDGVEPDGPRCSLCAVGEDIHTKANLIDGLHRVVQSLIERLDV